MFDRLPFGKIDAASDLFAELSSTAQSRLDEIDLCHGHGWGGRFRRHVALSKLNALLSFYGWAIRRDGTMFEVRVRGAPVDLGLGDKQELPVGSVEELNERVRNCFIETGKLIDPRTGRHIPYSERHWFGIT